MLCVIPHIGNTRLMTDYRHISAYRPRLAMRQMPRYRIKIGIWRNLATTPIHHRRVTYPAVRRTNIILSSVPRAYNDGRGGTSANQANIMDGSEHVSRVLRLDRVEIDSGVAIISALFAKYFARLKWINTCGATTHMTAPPMAYGNWRRQCEFAMRPWARMQVCLKSCKCLDRFLFLSIFIHI